MPTDVEELVPAADEIEGAQPLADDPSLNPLDDRITADGEPAPRKEATPPPGPDKEVRRLEKQLARERNARRDAETNARTWYERLAASQGAGGKPVATQPEPESPKEEDLVDAIQSGDKGRIRAALKQVGLATVDDVETHVSQRVEARMATVTRDAGIYDRFPDMRDTKSELFRTAQQIYARRMEADPNARANPFFMEDCTNAAAMELGVVPKRAGARLPKYDGVLPDGDDDDDEEEPALVGRGKGEEPEQERADRIRSQSAGSGRARGPARAGSDDRLSSVQREIARKFGVTEAEYAKHARAGVRMAGRPR
jgi:hypothetical protein